LGKTEQLTRPYQWMSWIHISLTAGDVVVLDTAS